MHREGRLGSQTHISWHAGLPVLGLPAGLQCRWFARSLDLAEQVALGTGRTTFFLLIAVNCPGI